MVSIFTQVVCFACESCLTGLANADVSIRSACHLAGWEYSPTILAAEVTSRNRYSLRRSRRDCSFGGELATSLFEVAAFLVRRSRIAASAQVSEGYAEATVRAVHADSG